MQCTLIGQYAATRVSVLCMYAHSCKADTEEPLCTHVGLLKMVLWESIVYTVSMGL